MDGDVRLRLADRLLRNLHILEARLPIGLQRVSLGTHSYRYASLRFHRQRGIQPRLWQAQSYRPL